MRTHAALLSQAAARRASAASRSRFEIKLAMQRAMKAATAARAHSESDITVSPPCCPPAGLPALAHPVPALFFRTTLL